MIWALQCVISPFFFDLTAYMIRTLDGAQRALNPCPYKQIGKNQSGQGVASGENEVLFGENAACIEGSTW